MTRTELDDATDEELLRRYIERRSEPAFRLLVERHAAMVMGTAKRILRNPEDAEDAFQATFLALAKAADKLRSGAAIAAWLHQTARRCSLSILRIQKRSKKVKTMSDTDQVDAPDLGNTNDDPSARVANEELEAILDEEISRLPRDLQTAMVLCDLEGKTRKQAAKETGVPLPTMTSHVMKARRLLSERLVRRGVSTSVTGLAAFSVSSAGSPSHVSAQLISDTTAKALRFTAGQSASDVGVSPHVINTANEILLTMTKAKIVAISLAAITTLLLVGPLAQVLNFTESTAKAEFLIAETFDDGDFTDGDPILWKIAESSTGSIDASSGDLVLSVIGGTNVNLNPELIAIKDLPADTSSRAIVRVGVNWGAGIKVRGHDQGEFRGYVASVNYLPQGGVSVLGVGKELQDGTAEFLSPFVTLPFDVREVDTAIQLDVFDDTIEIWAWPDGEAFPDDSLIRIIDRSIAGAGFTALVETQNPVSFANDADVTFREFYVAESSIRTIPEPKTLALSASALLCLFACRRNYRVSCGDR